jgi:hypothetical protein
VLRPQEVHEPLPPTHTHAPTRTRAVVCAKYAVWCFVQTLRCNATTQTRNNADSSAHCGRAAAGRPRVGCMLRVGATWMGRPSPSPLHRGVQRARRTALSGHVSVLCVRLLVSSVLTGIIAIPFCITCTHYHYPYSVVSTLHRREQPRGTAAGRGVDGPPKSTSTTRKYY